MKLKFGDMWKELGNPGLFVITVNGTVDASGKLVMGAGIAEQAAKRWPRLPVALGRAFRLAGQRVSAKVYKLPFFVMPTLPSNNQRSAIAVLQTKYHFREMSSLDLIAEGLLGLTRWCDENPGVTVNMPMPGTGYGRQPINRVVPLVKPLPDNVFVWRYEYERGDWVL